MVNALIKLNDNSNKILNIVKIKHGFRDKGETVEFIIQKFAEHEQEPELLQEFVNKINKIEKQKSISVDNFAQRYGLS